MRYKVLAICDTESTYAEFLTKQLLRIKNHGLQIHNFTSIEQLKKFALQEVIHYVVISDLFEDNIQEIYHVADRIYWLTTNKQKCWEVEDNTYIYRYQSAQDIFSLINRKIEVDERDILLEEGQSKSMKTKVVGVYSPVHRNGQTMFAKAVASTYCGEFVRALYINLEEYSGVEEQEDEGNLADFLYFLKQDSDESEMKRRLKTFIKSGDDYDYITPMTVSWELKNVEQEEWSNMITTLKKISPYEAIVLDLDSCIRGFADVIKECDIVYMPVRTRFTDEKKRQQFERNLRLFHPEEEKKFLEVQIPECESEERGEILESIKRYAICLAKEEAT